jgi:hypothetical protein
VANPMSVVAEAWPVAADEAGIWLISGTGAWYPDTEVMSDSLPHFEVELALHEHGIKDKPAAMHSTSWRVEGMNLVVAYMAVIRPINFVREEWPGALPITIEMSEMVGKPPTHAANEPPGPRHIDVLMHGLRHLRFLMDNDATIAAAMGDTWRRHLAPFTPVLATMYDQLHDPAA